MTLSNTLEIQLEVGDKVRDVSDPVQSKLYGFSNCCPIPIKDQQLVKSSGMANVLTPQVHTRRQLS